MICNSRWDRQAGSRSDLAAMPGPGDQGGAVGPRVREIVSPVTSGWRDGSKNTKPGTSTGVSNVEPVVTVD